MCEGRGEWANGAGSDAWVQVCAVGLRLTGTLSSPAEAARTRCQCVRCGDEVEDRLLHRSQSVFGPAIAAGKSACFLRARESSGAKHRKPCLPSGPGPIPTLRIRPGHDDAAKTCYATVWQHLDHLVSHLTENLKILCLPVFWHPEVTFQKCCRCAHHNQH